jgi:hypothetical protein
MPIIQRKHGRSVRIYFSDGSEGGIRHAEILHWTGQAVACPRSRIKELQAWDELKRPGVYFLIGPSETNDQMRLYIGEAESVLARLGAKDHLEREFWNEVVAITNKDLTLTKAHVKYLESRAVEVAREAERYDVTNDADPSRPSLHRAEVDAMEEFLENIALLLGALGLRPFEPVGGKLAVEMSRGAAAPVPAGVDSVVSEASAPETVLALETKGIKARALLTDDGLVVLKGSQMVAEPNPSLVDTYRKERDRLVQNGVVVERGGALEFLSNWLAGTPSRAASVIAGGTVNGRLMWRDGSGKTFGDIEESAVELAHNSLPISQVGERPSAEAVPSHAA